MRIAKAKQIVAKLEQDYSFISSHFSQTRHHAWKDFFQFLPLMRPGCSVLDVGCGNGRLLGFLHEQGCTVSYTGCDMSSALLDTARQQYSDASFVRGALPDTMPCKEGSFDLVFAIAVLHHLPKPLQAASVQTLFRLLRPGGFAIVSVWNLFQPQFFWARCRALLRSIGTVGTFSPHDLFFPWSDSGISRYYYAFQPAEFSALFSQAGFIVERTLFLRHGSEVDWKCSANMWLFVRRPS